MRDNHRTNRAIGAGLRAFFLFGACASVLVATSCEFQKPEATVDFAPIDPGAGGEFSSCDGGCAAVSAPGMCISPDGSACGIATVVNPSFGPTVAAATPPPPISGGTLLALADGKTLVASDPDRDTLSIVDVTTAAVTSSIALHAGDEPGRLVEDAAGRVHVALRSGGALVTIDPIQGTIVSRRAVCPAPRGVAYQSSTDVVWVACATGELVALPAGGGTATSSFKVERDLRDVLVAADGSLSVTTFRSAEILRLGADGSILRRDSMAQDTTPDMGLNQPHVLWRAVEAPPAGDAGMTPGAIVAVHQLHSLEPISTTQVGGYGSGGAPPAITSHCSVIASDGSPSASIDFPGVLPVDVAVSPDGATVVVATAGQAFGAPGGESIAAFSVSAPTNPTTLPPVNGLLEQTGVVGQAIAVAFDPAGDLAVQFREPSTVVFLSFANGTAKQISLSLASRDDTGHDIFHTATSAGLACASCHPEGGDDSHVWTLDGNSRRTPSLRGTIAGTAPYHWPGDEPDLVQLTNDVYTGRMAGGQLNSDQMAALSAWIQTIPAPPPPSWIDAASAVRGSAVFERGDTLCATCHSGAKLTNNLTVYVGTGQPFQVPPLIGVGWRAPFLHDGCAKTIADRFGACATQGHGGTAQLGTQDLADLEMYLESL